MKHKFYILTLFLLGLSISLFSQGYLETANSMHEGGAKFAEIIESIELDTSMSSNKQYQRWKYYNSTRLTADGYLQNIAKENWDEYYDYQQKNSELKSSNDYHGNWKSYGATKPIYIQGSTSTRLGTGRVNCIAVDPDDKNIVYAGTPGGGLWKTTDKGESWQPLTDGMPRLGVSGIVIDPVSPKNYRTIYMLTGDGDGGNTPSLGVFKSIDNGETWYSTGLEFDANRNVRGYKLISHPNNNELLYAATSDGLFKTLDGGVSWEKVVSDYFFDIEINTGDPEILYASSKRVVYKRDKANIAIKGNWEPIHSFDTFATSRSRIAIATAPSAPNYLYVLWGYCNNEVEWHGEKCGGIELSTDGGSSFQHMYTGSQYYFNQYWYDMAIAVSPTNPDEVYMGLIWYYKSENSGRDWRAYSTGMHADVHALEFIDEETFYCANDGGVCFTDDLSVRWQNLSAGLETTQYYRLGTCQSQGGVVTGGSQDNGTMLLEDDYMKHWNGGDGMECFIDPLNPDYLYGSSQNGGIVKHRRGSTSSRSVKPREVTTKGPWITPFIMDPSNNNTIYSVYADAYKSNDRGDNWTNISNGQINSLYWQESFIAVAPSDTNYIYVSKGNNLYATKNCGVNWEVIKDLDGPSISSFAIHPYNKNILWLCHGQTVLKTTDAGDTWEDITGNLPAFTKNTVVYQKGSNDRVYVGMDVGVYYLDNSTNPYWINFSDGLANVEVSELEINYSDNKLYAATFGRSIWTSELLMNCNDDLTVNVPGPKINSEYIKDASTLKYPGEYVKIQAEDFYTTGGKYAGFEEYSPANNLTAIKYNQTGDWGTYIISGDIQTGVYKLKYAVGTGVSGAAIQLSVNEEQVAKTAVPNNGNWDSFSEIESEEFVLRNGEDITLTLQGAGTNELNWEWNMDYFKLVLVESKSPVAGIELDNNNSVTLNINGTVLRTADVLPSNAVNTKVIWSSSSPNVASVKEFLVSNTMASIAEVRGLSLGKTTITATTEEGEYKSEFEVVVNDPNAPVLDFEAEACINSVSSFSIYQSSNGIAINANSGNYGVYTLPQYESGEYEVEYLVGSANAGASIEMKVFRTNASEPELVICNVPNIGAWDEFEWVKADKTIKLEANQSGHLSLKAMGQDGKVLNLDRFRLKKIGVLNFPVENISANKKGYFINPGNSVNIQAVISPSFATNNKVLWTSNNPYIVTIPAETVTIDHLGTTINTALGRSEGTTTITATTEDGDYSIDYDIRVVNTTNTYSIESENALWKDFGEYSTGGGTAVRVDSGQAGMYKLPSFTSGSYIIEFFAGCAEDDFTISLKRDLDASDIVEIDIHNNANSNNLESVYSSEPFDLKVGAHFNIWLKAKGANANSYCNLDKFRLIRVGSIDNTPESITLNSNSIIMEQGETFDLNATVNPSYAASQDITWYSSNTDIAEVDQNGKVTYKSSGEAVIVAKTPDKKVTASCIVYALEVNPKVIQADNYSSTTGFYETNTGEIISTATTGKVNYRVEMLERAFYKVIAYVKTTSPSAQIGMYWRGSVIYKPIAGTMVNGYIPMELNSRFGVSIETITLTIHTNNNTSNNLIVIDRIELVRLDEEPYIPVKGVNISHSAINLATSESFQLTAEAFSGTASYGNLTGAPTNSTVEWFSSNQDIVSVDDKGLITRHKRGDVIISAVSNEGGYVGKCLVTYNKQELIIEAEDYTLTGGTFNDVAYQGPGYGVNRRSNSINYVNRGDWVNYKVDIEEDGKYEIEYMIGTGEDAAAIEVSINNKAYHTDYVPNNGNWDEYNSLVSEKYFELKRGSYTFKLTGAGERDWQWNMDKFIIRKAGEICDYSFPTFKSRVYKPLTGTYAGPMPGLISEVEGAEEELIANEDNLAIYPNPASGEFTISFEVNSHEPTTIHIMSIVGEVQSTIVSSEVLAPGKYEMNAAVDNLDSGIYLVKFTNGGTTGVERLVIKK